MSLSGGLIPLGGGGNLKPMTDSAQSSPSKDAGFDRDFDAMLDEMLEAPTRKSSRSKSSKPKKKKSHRSRALDSPASSPTKSDAPLSPHLEESVDDTFFPRNVAAADLDDSILGGLMGGGGRKLNFKPSATERKLDTPPATTAPAASMSSKQKDLSVKTHTAAEFDDSLNMSFDDALPAPKVPASTTAASTSSTSFASTSLRPATTTSSSLRNVKSWDEPQAATKAPSSFGSRRAKSSVVSHAADNDAFTSSASAKPADQEEASATTSKAKTYSFNDSFNDDDLLPLPMGQDDLLPDNSAKANRVDDDLPAPSLNRGDSTSTGARLNSAESAAPEAHSDGISSSNRPLTGDVSLASREDNRVAGDGDKAALVPKSNNVEPVIVPTTAPVTAEPAQKSAADNDVDIGFTPSFLEGGRDTRRRRQLGSRNISGKTPRSRPTTGGSDSMDALDRALGLGPPTVGPGTSSGRVLKSLGESAELGSPDDKRSYHRPLSEHPTSSTSFRNAVEVVTEAAPSTSAPATGRRESQEKTTPATARQDVPPEKEKQHPSISLPSLTTPGKSSLYLDIHSMSRNYDNSDDESAPAPVTSAPATVSSRAAESSRGDTTHRETHHQDTEHHHHHHKSLKTSRKSHNAQHQHQTVTDTSTGDIDQSLDGSMSIVDTKDKGDPPTPTPRTSGAILKRSSSSFEVLAAKEQHSASKRDLHRTQSSLSASQMQQQTSQATPPKRSSGQGASWLHAPSPGVSTALATASFAGSGQDVSVRQLHQKIDELQIQKDAVEKYLRREIEELRRTHAGDDLTSSTANEAYKSHDAHYAEIAELKGKLAVLTTENSRLKEELALDSMRKTRELNSVRDRHEADMESASTARLEEVAMLERRHAESIQQLKNMHLEEIAAIKMRVRDGSALEGLTTQIKSTSGSLKMLEEKMSLQYRGIDTVREGQFEARERLLQDLEEKARERADAAEKEGYRLKGMLSHMEQMVLNLRSQNGEERERLRHEHLRLDALQQSLENERIAMRSRVSDEMASVQRKAQEHLQEVRAWKEEKLHQQAELQEMRRSLDVDKAEFAAHVANSIKSAEATAKRLKDEEERLQKLRSDVENDVAALERKRSEALADLKAAAAAKATIASAQEEIRRERAALQEAAESLQEASDSLLRRDDEISKKVEYLQQTEREVKSARGDLEGAYNMLRQREHEIADAARFAESQKLSIKMLEDTMLQKRVTASGLLREASRKQSEAAKHSLMNPSSPASKVPKRDPQDAPPSVPSPQSVASASPPAPHQIPLYDDHAMGVDLSKLHDEVAKAKRAMQRARGGLSTASTLKVETQSFLMAEQDFFSKINRSR